MARPNSVRTQAQIDEICRRVQGGVTVNDIARYMKISSTFVTEVRQYFLQKHKFPQLGFEPVPAMGIRANGEKPFQRNSRGFPVDEAKLHLAELKAAEREQEERAERRKRATLPYTGSAFIAPIPLSRLMGGRA